MKREIPNFMRLKFGISKKVCDCSAVPAFICLAGYGRQAPKTEVSSSRKATAGLRQRETSVFVFGLTK